jgi:hypothetical protein
MMEEDAKVKSGITLVNSNYYFLGRAYNPPQGLLILSPCLKKRGIDTSIVDLNLMVNAGDIAIDAGFNEKAAGIILSRGDKVIGFNTRCDSYPSVINIARCCKEKDPGRTIILGGPHATQVDVETLEAFKFIDIIVRGEGEETLSELCLALAHSKPLSGIRGITYRLGGKAIRNADRKLIADLDSLPLPDYGKVDDAIKRHERLFKKLPTDVIVGRGCPYGCYYCSSSLMWRRKFRMRSVESVGRELRHLRDAYGCNVFTLNHDHLTADRGYLLGLCAHIQANVRGISWVCSSRIDGLDAPTIETMSKAGCTCIYFGIETGSPRMQKAMNKNLRLGNVDRILECCRANGIGFVASFIIGFPEETEKDLAKTLQLAAKAAAKPNCRYIQIHKLTVHPGTKLMERTGGMLEYTGSFSNQVKSPMMKNPENLGLVRRYPRIFSPFYHVRCRFEWGLLDRVEDIYSNLINEYPRTLIVASDDTKTDFYGIFSGFDRYLREKEAEINLRNSRAELPGYLHRLYASEGRDCYIMDALYKIERQRRHPKTQG